MEILWRAPSCSVLQVDTACSRQPFALPGGASEDDGVLNYGFGSSMHARKKLPTAEPLPYLSSGKGCVLPCDACQTLLEAGDDSGDDQSSSTLEEMKVNWPTSLKPRYPQRKIHIL
jgi:hypothetical protein